MSVVSLVLKRERSIEAAVGEAVELVGKLDQIVTKRSRVLVKLASFKDRGIYVPGCPPRGWALTEAICNACRIAKEPVIAAIEKIHGNLVEIR